MKLIEITKSAQRLREINLMLPDAYGGVRSVLLTEKQTYINFKNELKEKRNGCKCDFCKWIDNLIREIEISTKIN